MKLAISIGDPNGIGPEIVLKVLADQDLRVRAEPVVVGSRRVLEHYAGPLGLSDALSGVEVVEVPGADRVDIDEGLVTTHGGDLAIAAVAAACDLCRQGEVGAMVTAPISKEAIFLAGHEFPGHTEYLAHRTGAEGFAMVMVAGALRVAVLTTHLPLRDVPANVTTGGIGEMLARLDAGLRADFGIAGPRIAVLGLNPHAGDGGVIGTEELHTIAPGIAVARGRGVDASGPFAADAFFGRRSYEDFDAVLACYHDQGLVPFKTLAMGRGVNVTLGLPIVRTSPDHGTAFDIAGRGLADPGSLLAACHLAVEIAERRAPAAVEA